MRSYARRLDQHQTVINHTAGTSTFKTFAGAKWDDFTVTGFGPNPGRKFIDPTPGEYKKQIWDSTHGESSIRNFNIWTGETTGFTTKSGYHGDEWGGSMHSQYPVDYNNTVYNNALSEVYEGVRQSEINLAVMIGELHESGRMLQVGRSIYEVLLTARRARRRFLSNPSLAMSQVWLSYKYGWSPFLSEIYGMLNWQYHLFNEGLPVRGRSRRYDNPNYTWTSPSYPFHKIRITGTKFWQAEVKLWVGLADSTHYNLSRISSLNPVSIAWELVPLSFVADWFLDVGGYLQNMEAALGSSLVFKKGYVTEVVYSKLNQSTTFDATAVSSLPWAVRRQGQLQNEKFDVWKRRIKLNSNPLPRAPSFEVRLGWQRIVSAAALLRTILLGGVDDQLRPPRRGRRARR